MHIRSSLKWCVNSSAHAVIDNILVTRFITGLFNLHPPPVRPVRDVWDINILLHYWDSLPCNTDLPIMFLSQKVVTLLLISTMKRRADILQMRVDNYYFEPHSMVFPLLMYPKTYTISSPDDELRHILVKQFSDNPNLCPLRAVQHYIHRTSAIRNTQALFITTQNPYTAAASMTVRRWILSALDQAGIDVNKYCASSTRHASSSKAYFVGVSVDEVMRRAGWAQVSSFVLHYNLPIVCSKPGQRRRIDKDHYSKNPFPRWNKGGNLIKACKTAKDFRARKALQTARQNVFRNAIKFNNRPFVAPPPAMPRLQLSSPRMVHLKKSVTKRGKTKVFKQREVPVMVSSIPLHHQDLDSGSDTEPAEDV